MEEVKSIQLFQVRDKMIVGVCVTEDITEKQREYKKEFIADTVVITVKDPMQFFELIVPNVLDGSKTLTQRLKPFFGNPESLNINVKSIDQHYNIFDQEIILQYLKIVEEFKSLKPVVPNCN